VLVTVGTGDAQAAASAAKNGADVIIIAGWQPGADVSAIAAAASAEKAVWGVELSAEGRYSDGTLKQAQEAGASFALVGQSSPAGALFEELDGFDLMVQVEIPKDDLALALLRAENLLPAQVALLNARLSSADLARMTVADYARLRLACESLRFPVVLGLAEAPQDAQVKTLVRLGVSGLALRGGGAAVEALGGQVKALREQLEKTPAKPEDRGGPVAIGGLMEASGQSLRRQEPVPAPGPEPDEE
jgi:hypothetical protein